MAGSYRKASTHQPVVAVSGVNEMTGPCVSHHPAASLGIVYMVGAGFQEIKRCMQGQMTPVTHALKLWLHAIGPSKTTWPSEFQGEGKDSTSLWKQLQSHIAKCIDTKRNED